MHQASIETTTRRTFLRRSLGVGASLSAVAAAFKQAQAQSSQGFDRNQAAHLLRRAGFGGTQEEIDNLVQLGKEGAVDYLLNYEQIDDSAMEAELAKQNFFPDPNQINPRQAQGWWLFRMAYTKRPLLEKMVLFWHNHFATAVKKVGNMRLMLKQNELFRKFALAKFDTILLEVAKDPAMIIWLDNNTNIKGNPNENFARELMELFTMGINDVISGQPNYTEQDIKESARAFTGWTIRQGEFFFNSNQHDYGQKTFLGQTGDFNGDNIINILAPRQATARFMSKKLFEFFAYPSPEPEIIEALAKVYLDSKFDIKAVMRHLLLMDAFYSDKARYAIIKSPTEFVVGTLRMLKANINVRSIPFFMSLMEQDLFNPPDVAGWDMGLGWISTATMLARYNFANTVATARGGNVGTFSPEALLQGKDLQTPEAVVEYFLTLLGPLTVSDQAKQVLTDLLRPASGSFTLDALTIDQKVRGLVHLIMTLPHYHLS